MADYRRIMTLLLQQRPYRQIEVMAGCSHRAIARARRVLDAERLSTAAQIEALTVEDLDRLFADGRKTVSGSSSRWMSTRWWLRAWGARSRR